MGNGGGAATTTITNIDWTSTYDLNAVVSSLTRVFVTSTSAQYANAVAMTDPKSATVLPLYGWSTQGSVANTTTGTLYVDFSVFAISGDTTCTLQGYSVRIDGN